MRFSSKKNRVDATLKVLLLAFLLISRAASGQSWSMSYPGIGTFSSPRATDLNQDGVKDIVLGMGRAEFQACDTAVVAIDGRNGKMIWSVGAIDQIFGSAGLLDINGDSVQDVIIGGRSAELIAIDGKTGKEFWRFDKTARGVRWYNFYNPQFIPDQDGDDLADILISNGGNVLAEPHQTRNRPPGYLVIISSRTGKLLTLAKMPDKREIYMSVSVAMNPHLSDLAVSFGTGGETVGGNLYTTSLKEVLAGDISKARLFDKSRDKGFVAPALWTDINADGVPDLVANAVEGRMCSYDGASGKKIWCVRISGAEAYSSIAVGNFNGDAIPDFFASYAVGSWPKLEWSHQFMVDGKSGKILFEDSLGFYQTSSPVVADLNGDGVDEVILSVNIHVYDDFNNKSLNNMLVSIDFSKNEVQQLTEFQGGSNISTTPWIGDLDSDGLLDIVHCHATNLKKPYTFDGVQINRIATQIPVYKEIKWGAYMGSNYDGAYLTQQTSLK